jgi:hypothetical protein
VGAGTAEYVLFHTALDRVSGLQCIGRAEARAPAGPFVDDSATPLVCQRTQAGPIDPGQVAIDGRITLYWEERRQPLRPAGAAVGVSGSTAAAGLYSAMGNMLHITDPVALDARTPISR